MKHISYMLLPLSKHSSPREYCGAKDNVGIRIETVMLRCSSFGKDGCYKMS